MYVKVANKISLIIGFKCNLVSNYVAIVCFCFTLHAYTIAITFIIKIRRSLFVHCSPIPSLRSNPRVLLHSRALRSCKFNTGARVTPPS